MHVNYVHEYKVYVLCDLLTLVDPEIAVNSCDAIEEKVGKAFIIRVLCGDVGHYGSHTQLFRNLIHSLWARKKCRRQNEFSGT